MFMVSYFCSQFEISQLVPVNIFWFLHLHPGDVEHGAVD